MTFLMKLVEPYDDHPMLHPGFYLVDLLGDGIGVYLGDRSGVFREHERITVDTYPADGHWEAAREMRCAFWCNHPPGGCTYRVSYDKCEDGSVIAAVMLRQQDDFSFRLELCQYDSMLDFWEVWSPV